MSKPTAGPCHRTLERGARAGGSRADAPQSGSAESTSPKGSAGFAPSGSKAGDGSKPKPPPPWYAKGLRFECQWPVCRTCCQGEEGYIWVTEAEVAALAEARGESIETLRRESTKMAFGKRTLRERANGDCVMLGEDGCSVYDARPGQCRSYPFWPEIVESAESWEAETAECPGLNKGALHDRATIEARRKMKPKSPWG